MTTKRRTQETSKLAKSISETANEQSAYHHINKHVGKLKNIPAPHDVNNELYSY